MKNDNMGQVDRTMLQELDKWLWEEVHLQEIAMETYKEIERY